ncbi:ATP-binding protein [Pseudoduganella sp. GCM10020061]|uniref:hybrid sensor histidine kinase/response regulator n=1 Tax=Pseudoduganella sp. GCM10020061 TaxID=3317345 RepID=UPI003628029E
MRKTSDPSASSPPVRLLLTRLVLACLVPGVVAATLFFAYQYRESRLQQERITVQTAHALVQVVDNHLFRAQAVAQTLARSVALAELDFARFRLEARAAVETLGGNTNVVVRDRDGNHVFNALAAPGATLPRADNPQHVRPVIESGTPLISNVFTAAMLKRPTAAVNVPVFIDGHPRYALAVSIMPEYFTQMLLDQPLPPGWIVAILDSAGVVAGRSQSPARFVGKAASPSLVATLRTHDDGVLETTTLEGVKVLTVFKRSPQTRWVVAIGIPKDQMGVSSAVPVARLAVGVSLLFAIGLALAWYMGGRIARSVQALIAPAAALGRGTPAPAPDVHFREAEEVAHAIGQAARVLEQHEAMIKARDEELDQAHRLAKFGNWLLDPRTGEVATTGSFTEIYGRDVPPFSQQRGVILAEESWDRVDAATKEIISSGGSYDLELEGIHASGRRIWVNAKSEAVLDQEGRTIAVRGTVQDITERKQHEEALRLADQRKDEFLAMLAHELRNPLAPIAAAADLLRITQESNGTVRNASAIIARQVKHMSALIDDLLDVSRVTRGLVTLDMQPVDMRAVVADAIEQVLPLAAARKHALARPAPGGPALVMGDHKRLVQVLTNLLNNAIKFTPPGGRIEVGVEVSGGEACVAVSDNGIGMPPDLVEGAFELFAQGERSPDRSQGGLGIGLALVRSLVELHGGHVTAHSRGPGHGSRFTVCLPHAQGQRMQPGETHASAPVCTPARVLIVDDNADAAHTLAMLVRALGHETEVALSSAAALEMAPAFAPQACLLDIGLPDIDGYELARRLRAQPVTAHAWLVAVTGYGQEQDRADALAAGFDAHFVKPVDTGRLAQVLARER